MFVYTLAGHCLAHGSNIDNVNRTLSSIIARSDHLSSNGVSGDALNLQFNSTALRGGGWVSYPWYSDALGTFEKMAYIVPLSVGGEPCYMGVGYNERSADGSGGQKPGGQKPASDGATVTATAGPASSLVTVNLVLLVLLLLVLLGMFAFIYSRLSVRGAQPLMRELEVKSDQAGGSQLAGGGQAVQSA